MSYKINLLPAELQSKPPVNLRRLFLLLLSIFVFAGLLASYGFFLWNYQQVSKQLGNLNQNLPRIEREVARLEGIKKQRLDLERRSDQLEALLQTRQKWPGMLTALTKVVPGDVWLTSLRLEEIREKQTPMEKKVPAGASLPMQPNVAQKSLESIQKSLERATPEESKETKTKLEGASTIPGVPNTLFLEGASYSVPSVGIFIYHLQQLPYFSKVALTDLHFEESKGHLVFTVVANLKAGANNGEQIR